MSLPAVVVDTGAILRHASFLDPNISYYAPSCVIAEVQDKQGREYFERIASFLTIQEPESTDVDFVRQLARVTGDFPQLSAQDIRVLALVVQLCRSRNLSVRSIEDAKVLLLRPDIRRKRISNGGAASVETKEHEAEPAVGDGQASDNKEDKIFVTEFVTEYDKDDGEGQWITSENFEETSQSHTKEVEMDKLPLVSCVTGDFSMQNVLFVLGVPVVSPHGKRIQTIRRWAQICSACGTVEKEAKSPFCRACGYASLRRVPLTMGKSGQERVILRDRRANLKGTIFKAPTPLGGKQTDKSLLLAPDMVMMGGRDREQRHRDKLRAKELANTSWDAWTTNDSLGVVANKDLFRDFQVGYGKGNRNSNRFQKRNGNKK